MTTSADKKHPRHRLTESLRVQLTPSPVPGTHLVSVPAKPDETDLMLVPLAEYSRLCRIEREADYYVTGAKNNWDALVDSLKKNTSK